MLHSPTSLLTPGGLRNSQALADLVFCRRCIAATDCHALSEQQVDGHVYQRVLSDELATSGATPVDLVTQDRELIELVFGEPSLLAGDGPVWRVRAAGRATRAVSRTCLLRATPARSVV